MGTRRWIFLVLALCWALLSVVIILRYHLKEPAGTTSITTNGHTYYGRPPALTLEERDPFSAAFITVALSVGLLVAAADLSVRQMTRRRGWGVPAVAAGVALMMISLLGLLWGLAGIGVTGALLILSGWPAKPA